MEPSIPSFQNQQPTIQQFKPVPNNKMLIYIIIAVISATISGLAVWFFMNQQNDSDKKTLMSQITAKDTSIADLQKTITNPAVTPVNNIDITTNTPIVATDDISTLKSFCITDSTMYSLGNFFYASVPSGIYGGCSIGSIGGSSGYYEVTKKVNDVWTEVISGQGNDTAFLKESLVPLNVFVSPNAYDLLP